MTDEKPRYLMIGSRDPFESRDVGCFLFATAVDLRSAGHRVTVFLVQNGALAARRGALVPSLEDALHAGVEVVVDEFSLKERGIGPEQMAPALATAPIAFVIDRMVAGDKVLWH